MSELLGQAEGLGRKGHVSANLPCHRSFMELVARVWLESVGFARQLRAAERKPLSPSLGSRTHSGHRGCV